MEFFNPYKNKLEHQNDIQEHKQQTQNNNENIGETQIIQNSNNSIDFLFNDFLEKDILPFNLKAINSQKFNILRNRDKYVSNLTGVPNIKLGHEIFKLFLDLSHDTTINHCDVNKQNDKSYLNPLSWSIFNRDNQKTESNESESIPPIVNALLNIELIALLGLNEFHFKSNQTTQNKLVLPNALGFLVKLDKDYDGQELKDIVRSDENYIRYWFNALFIVRQISNQYEKARKNLNTPMQIEDNLLVIGLDSVSRLLLQSAPFDVTTLFTKIIQFPDINKYSLECFKSMVSFNHLCENDLSLTEKMFNQIYISEKEYEIKMKNDVHGETPFGSYLHLLDEDNKLIITNKLDKNVTNNILLNHLIHLIRHNKTLKPIDMHFIAEVAVYLVNI